MGILTFPSEFTPEKFNMDLKTFIETGIKTIENICKELDIELIYITCHLDEETPHMHLVYMPVVNAKDKKGNTYDNGTYVIKILKNRIITKYKENK